MDVSSIIIAIWSAAGVCFLAGVALSAWAVRGQAIRRSVGERCPDSHASQSETFCACCGYSAAGLESETCPECGQSLAGSQMAAHMRRRVLAGVAGAVMMLLSASAPVADQFARVGWAHAMPAGALAFVGKHVEYGRLHLLRHLMGRAESHALGRSDRAAAARMAESVLTSEQRTQVRREAALLLRSVADAASDAAIRSALRDLDPNIRECGVRTLARSSRADSLATTTLLGIAASDRHPKVRREAIESLRIRGLGDPRREQVLDAALDDTAKTVRIRAIYAIGDTPRVAHKTLHRVAMLLAASDEEVREAAIWAMARYAERQGVSLGASLEMLRSASSMLAWAAPEAVLSRTM